jgi:hypothetical protein
MPPPKSRPRTARPGSSGTTNRPPAPRRRWWRALLLTLLAVVLITAAVTGVALTQLGIGAGGFVQALGERTPVEMIGHVQRRLQGHPRLESMLGPVLIALRDRYVREPGAAITDLGKGQRPGGLTPQRYDAGGAPLAAEPAVAPVRPPVADRILVRADDIAAALADASPGQVLEIAPGRYELASTLHTRRGGSAAQPITLRAARPGSVTLRVAAREGIVVAHPHWIFENLDWHGACAADSGGCEHAFHIVGAARATVVRNNRITDFHSQLKINGEGGQWPDQGLLQYSTLSNAGPRPGTAPVALVDLVGASGWQLLDNQVQGFIKAGGDGIAYGMFMKGGGRGGRIERNVVVCTPSAVTQPGLRVGISIGAGGTDAAFCRDRRCTTEHEGALVANNVVAHCNDAGIDISHAREARVVHNTLINTQGVLLRNPPAEATVSHNLLDSALYARAGTQLTAHDNFAERSLERWLAAPDALDLRWREAPGSVGVHPLVPLDLCARRRALANPPGAGGAVKCS